MTDVPPTAPPPSTAGRLLGGLGLGALIGGMVGWGLQREAFAAAWGDVVAQGWWAARLDRLVGLALADVLLAFDRAVLIGAAGGLLLGALIKLRRIGLGLTLLRALGLLLVASVLWLESVRLETAARTAAGKPHVVWIVIDALRADHLGCYGYPADTSPFLDEIAAQSTRFELALSQESYTMASVASYFTSRYPPETGVLYDQPDIDALGLSFVTLAEVMQNAGYDTGAFVFNPHLWAKYQFDQGFDVYDDSYPHLGDGRITEQTPVWEGYETARPMQRKLTAFLEHERFADSGRPKLLYLHYRDVHGPYAPPPDYQQTFLPDDYGPELRDYLAEYLNRPIARLDEPCEPPIPAAHKPGWPFNAAGLPFVLSQYNGEIRYTDDALRRLFELLAEHGIDFENSIVVVTADHGEEFLDRHPGDTPEWSHGRTLYMEQVHVPLIVSLPEAWGTGRVVSDPVELVDVAPTVLDAAGLGDAIPASYRGRSLVPLLQGRSLSPRPVFAGGNHGRGLIVGDGLSYYRYEIESKFKRRYYARRPPEDYEFRRREELYRVADDRRQTAELLGGEPGDNHARVRALKGLLDEWLARRADGSGPRVALDDAARAQLEAMGYLGSDDEH